MSILLLTSIVQNSIYLKTRDLILDIKNVIRKVEGVDNEGNGLDASHCLSTFNLIIPIKYIDNHSPLQNINYVKNIDCEMYRNTKYSGSLLLYIMIAFNYMIHSFVFFSLEPLLHSVHRIDSMN